MAGRHLRAVVRLLATPATYVADVFARADLDDDSRHGRLALPSGRRSAGDWELGARFVAADGRTVFEAPLTRTGERRELEHALRSPRRWSAEDPALYTLALDLAQRSERRGRLSRRLPRVEVRDGRLLVNGQPVLIRGVNRHDHDDVRGRAVTPRADGGRRAADEALQRQRRAHARTTRTTPTGSTSATRSAST